MKRLFPIYFFILAIGLSQNNINVKNLVRDGERWVNKDNPNKLFSGIVYEISEETGIKILESRYFNGILHGKHHEWHLNGNKKIRGSYRFGKRNGKWISWYENGQKSSERIYKNGKVEGLEYYWYESGLKYRELTYSNNELISENRFPGLAAVQDCRGFRGIAGPSTQRIPHQFGESHQDMDSASRP